MLEVRELSKAFSSGNNSGDLAVLKRVSFRAETGEITAVVGPNGCGKTTLLRAIGRALKPDSGEILFDGANIGSASVKIGYIPQRLALMPWLNVKENVSFPLKLSSSHITNAIQRKEAVEQMLRMVGLLDFQNYFVSQLSGGMEQKVAIARGLVVNPHMLLMDEPFGSLDLFTRDELNSELLRIWGEQEPRPTIILVTHSIREAIRLSQKVVILSARPAVVKGIIRIPFVYPRQIEIESDQKFVDLVAEIRNCLKAENKKT